MPLKSSLENEVFLCVKKVVKISWDFFLLLLITIKTSYWQKVLFNAWKIAFNSIQVFNYYWINNWIKGGFIYE
jgi:hypothetical protein